MNSDPFLQSILRQIKTRKPSKPKENDSRRTKYKPEYCEIVSRLSACGYTQADVAWILGVSPSTIKAWRDAHEEFKIALTEGKRELKKRLVAEAVKQAIGFDFSERNTKRKKIKDAKGELLKEEELSSVYDKSVPPDGRMLTFLLCNLDRQLGDNEWQSVRQIEVKKDERVHVQIDGKIASDHIEKLAGKLLDRKYVESREVKPELEDEYLESREADEQHSEDRHTGQVLRCHSS